MPLLLGFLQEHQIEIATLDFFGKVVDAYTMTECA